MKKASAISLIVLLAIVAAAGAALGIKAMQASNNDERYIAANYRHAFSELVSGITDVDTTLQKSLLVTSPSMAGAVCTELYGKSQTAKMALGVLPFSSSDLEKTSSFIGKVGDYAYALSRKAARGEQFSQEEKDNLKKLSETAKALSQSFKSMQDELGSGLIGLDEYARTIENFDQNEGEVIPQTLGDSVSAAEQEFPEVPELIYDGPFSDHLRSVKPKMLEGQPQIDVSAGRSAAAQFVGVRPEQISPQGESGGDIPAYLYEVKLKGASVNISVSKQGGVVFQVIGSRAVEQAQLSAKEGLEAAKKALERRGYANMHESYYLITGNVLTANFAYMQDGVVCYPDLIKVGIALDDGSLQSFEASGYITAHNPRALPAAAITTEQAQSKVPSDVKVLSTALTLVPTEGRNELLCHEFECEDTNGQKYIIYVNAQTGEQEKIFILLQDKNGTLTL